MSPFRLLIAAVVLASSLDLRALAAPAADPLPSGIEEKVQVRQVRWPVILEPRGPDGERACSAIRPADVVVEEDGEPAKTSSIERERLPLLHVLLIDVSISMRDRLGGTKQAAIEYLEQLPPGERVIVATFDDSLTLLAGPTDDHKALEAAVWRIRLGARTALWDALDSLARYLEPLPDLKVLVLLSDGGDTSSLRQNDPEQVLRRLSAAPDLSVFVLGLELPDDGVENLTAQALLRVLAFDSGGRFYDIDSVRDLSGVFHDLRRQLEARSYVTYTPAPFGQGRRDDPSRESFRLRRVQVSAHKGIACRVRNVGSARRLEGVPPWDLIPVEIEAVRPGVPARSLAIGDPRSPDRASSSVPAGQPPSGDLCSPDRIRSSVVSTVRFGVWENAVSEGNGTPSRLDVLDPPGLIAGQINDLTIERGILFESKSYWKRRRFRTTLDRAPAFRSRQILVAVPPRDLLEREIIAPEDGLLFLLERFSCPATSGRDPSPDRSPFLINGTTFLSIRRPLALALLEEPGYRQGAASRLRNEMASEADALLGRMRASGTISEAEAEQIRSAILARALVPGPDLITRFLADWLGDRPARDLAIALERKLANRLLSAEGSDPGDLARSAATWWKTLSDWFAPATDARVLVPLVPVRDPARDSVGFYRVLLPRPVPYGAGPPPDRLPETPLAFGAIAFLLKPGGAGQDLRHLRVRSIGYGSFDALVAAENRMGPAGASPSPKIDREANSTEVWMSLSSEASPTARIALGASFSLPADELESPLVAVPVCLLAMLEDNASVAGGPGVAGGSGAAGGPGVAGGPGGAGGTLQETVSRLNQRFDSSGLLCGRPTGRALRRS